MVSGQDEEFVRALARGLALIEVFEGAATLSLTEAAKRCGLSRGTTRRLLLTLVSLGYMGTDGHRFWLRPRLLALGHAYLSSLSLPDVLLPHMEAMIGTRTHVSSSAAVLDDGDVVFVAGVPAKGLFRVSMSVGLRLPAYASSMGRVLLAEFSDVDVRRRLEAGPLRALTPMTRVDPAEIMRLIATARSDGYAIADREVDQALRSVAVPVRDRKGRCVAAISLTSHDASRSMEDVVAEFLPVLQGTAAKLTSEITAGVAT